MLFLPNTVKVSTESEESKDYCFMLNRNSSSNEKVTIAINVLKGTYWEIHEVETVDLYLHRHFRENFKSPFIDLHCHHYCMPLIAWSPVLERVGTICWFSFTTREKFPLYSSVRICPCLILECLSVFHRSKRFDYWRNNNQDLPKTLLWKSLEAIEAYIFNSEDHIREESRCSKWIKIQTQMKNTTNSTSSYSQVRAMIYAGN